MKVRDVDFNAISYIELKSKLDGVDFYTVDWIVFMVCRGNLNVINGYFRDSFYTYDNIDDAYINLQRKYINTPAMLEPNVMKAIDPELFCKTALVGFQMKKYIDAKNTTRYTTLLAEGYIKNALKIEDNETALKYLKTLKRQIFSKIDDDEWKKVLRNLEIAIKSLE